MSFLELFLTGIALSMDAFAVSLCRGLNMRKTNYAHAGVIAFFFGLFQALMPLIGWLLGKQFEDRIVAYDHWIAFVLLAFIGGKMIFDVIKGGDDEEVLCQKLNLKELLILSVATSIDALAVGVTFAFLGVNIVPAMSIIGITTFTISFFGVIIGSKTGARFKEKAQLAGGIVLILIGLKILAEHLLSGT